MQTCNSKLNLIDLLNNMLLYMGFLFAFNLLFKKTIEVTHRNDGFSGAVISNTSVVFYS